MTHIQRMHKKFQNYKKLSNIIPIKDLCQNFIIYESIKVLKILYVIQLTKSSVIIINKSLRTELKHLCSRLIFSIPA